MKYILSLLALALLAGCATEQASEENAERECRSGVYRNESGEALALTPLSTGGYRWRLADGRTGALRKEGDTWRSTLGWTGEPDGLAVDLSACPQGALRLGAPETSYSLEPIEVIETTFERDGVTFAGRLLLPPTTTPPPLVVHVHGSGSYSALQYEGYPWMLASEGLAVFVYDKRGTGASEGRYTQDFHVLAADARAALAEGRRLAGARVSRAGFMGLSQGGWVAPLAASEADVDFVVALYGLAVSPLQEDRAEVMQSLARAGWGEAEQAKGAELSAAAGEIIASDFRAGFAEFDRLRRAYRDEPWFADIEGEFTQQMLPYPSIALRVFGRARNAGTSWRYDPAPILRVLSAPQLWIIAADDTEAPSSETIARVRALQQEGRPIDLAVYHGADHGMIVTERGLNGERRQTRYVQDYYRQIAGWIRSREFGYARAAGAEVYEATLAQ
jgi:dienelactone hydrolase